MNAPFLAVDIGNSAIKLGLFAKMEPAEFPRPMWVEEISTPDHANFGEIGRHVPDDVAAWFVSSVNRPAEQSVARWVAANRPNDSYRLLNYRDVTIGIEVDFPDRVGFDRLATSVAANQLRSADRPAVVVDLGTALKVHVVSVAGNFIGGTISPGLLLSARALAGETDLLPHVPTTTNAPPPPVIGKNTEAAIRAGLYWSAVGSVRETLRQLQRTLLIEPQIFITGGDAHGLTGQIDGDVQFRSNLCLSGVAILAKSLPGDTTLS